MANIITLWAHSSKAVLDNKKAIRGGIPLVFPKFGPWSAGPNHGFARIQPWTVGKQGTDAEGPFVELVLSDNEATRAMWPHRFGLVFTVHLAAGARDVCGVCVWVDGCMGDSTHLLDACRL
jgi:D-hexose-6-phosphate mutarotase